MGLESATYVSDLVSTNPVATDKRKQGDDHLRLIKAALQATFPNASKAFYLPAGIDKSANFTILSSQANKIFRADATAAAFTLTLPTLTSGDDGWSVAIVKTDSTSHAVTIGGTVSGVASPTISVQYDTRVITWDGSRFLFMPKDSTKQSGSWQKIVTASGTGVSTLDLVGVSSSFDEYQIRADLTLSAAADLWLRVGTGGGPSYLSGASDYGWLYSALDDIASDEDFDNTSNHIIVATTITDTGLASARLLIDIDNLNSNQIHGFKCNALGFTAPTSFRFTYDGMGYNAVAAVITGLRLLPSSGTITGSASLYGRYV